jgi:quercetin dioxygenase-like cupin family protein
MQTEDFETAHTLDIGQAAMDFAAEVEGTAERKKKSLPAPAGLQSFLLYVRAHGYVPVHTVSGPITIQNIFGRASVATAEQSYELEEGEILGLGAGVPHDVSAVRETVLLVTHAPRD